MLSSDFITTFLSVFVVSVFSTLADSQRGTEEGLPGGEGYSSHREQESATTQVPPGRLRTCPSWNAKRTAETAAHLVDHVIPHVPVRQWVLSVPKRLRPFLWPTRLRCCPAC